VSDGVMGVPDSVALGTKFLFNVIHVSGVVKTLDNDSVGSFVEYKYKQV